MTIEVSPERTEQWVKTRDNRTGRQLAVAVPSATVENKFHLVSLTECNCLGFHFRGTCKHLQAVRAEAARHQLKADYAACWARHAELSAREDMILAHQDGGNGPLPLAIHFQLDTLRAELNTCERDLDRLQRELGQVA